MGSNCWEKREFGLGNAYVKLLSHMCYDFQRRVQNGSRRKVVVETECFSQIFKYDILEEYSNEELVTKTNEQSYVSQQASALLSIVQWAEIKQANEFMEPVNFKKTCLFSITTHLFASTTPLWVEWAWYWQN